VTKISVRKRNAIAINLVSPIRLLVCQPAISVNSNPPADILQQLKQHQADWQVRYGVTRIGVFGSVVWGEATPNSDIDIVVHMTPDLLQRVRLKTELESLFGKSVDVIRYRLSMNPYLKARIDQEARYVEPFAPAGIIS
jgi:predicted nucleotidyltransferase